MNNYLQPILLNINAIVCTIITVRVFLWRMKNRPENLIGACIIYLIIISAAAIPIRTLTGEYFHADWAEIVLNIALCWLCITKSGNLFTRR